MEINADIVIVGGGIAGLATALALHRLGIESLVLESSPTLRAYGIVLMIWTNAWKAFDALGIGDTLRKSHDLLLGTSTSSTVSGQPNSYVPFTTKGKYGEHEVRLVKRSVLLETLAKELPSGSIKLSAKVVSVQDENEGMRSKSKVVHLEDGSIVRAKVLIGCDGIKSAVAKWLGFRDLSLTGRFAIRGAAYYEGGHGLDNQFQRFMGQGKKLGIIPWEDKAVYWFMTWSPSTSEKKIIQEGDQKKLKEVVTKRLGKVPEKIRCIVEDTQLEEILCSPIGYRPWWEILFGNISKDNVCVAGDAFHTMTPDIGQGGCCALEDAIILAKCLAQVSKFTTQTEEEDDQYQRIQNALTKYASLRRWRAVDLLATGYLMGFLEESDWVGMNFLRENFLSGFLSTVSLNKANFDPASLTL